MTDTTHEPLTLDPNVYIASLEIKLNSVRRDNDRLEAFAGQMRAERDQAIEQRNALLAAAETTEDGPHDATD